MPVRKPRFLLKDEGISVSIINSNPATIMTDKVIADHVYLLPLTWKVIEKISTGTTKLMPYCLPWAAKQRLTFV